MLGFGQINQNTLGRIWTLHGKSSSHPTQTFELKGTNHQNPVEKSPLQTEKHHRQGQPGQLIIKWIDEFN